MNKIDKLTYERMFGNMKPEDDVIKEGKKETRKIRKNIKKAFDKVSNTAFCK